METKKEIKWTTYLACAYAEGFCEGEHATLVEKMQAWSYLIRTGLCWKLQGWYGRMANAYMEQGLISKEGEIDWDVFNDMLNR